MPENLERKRPAASADEIRPGVAVRSDPRTGGASLPSNDRPEVRRIFAGFAVEMVDCSYSIKGGVGKKVTEVIVTN